MNYSTRTIRGSPACRPLVAFRRSPSSPWPPSPCSPSDRCTRTRCIQLVDAAAGPPTRQDQAGHALPRRPPAGRRTAWSRAVGTEREGNRPERTTYEITDAGRDRAAEQHRPDAGPGRPTEYPVFPFALGEAHNLARGARSIRLLTDPAVQRCARRSARSRPASSWSSGQEPAVGLLAPARLPAHACSALEATWLESAIADIGAGRFAVPATFLTPPRDESQPRERDSLQAVAGPVGPRHRLLHDPRRHHHRRGGQPGDHERPAHRHQQGLWVTSAYLLAYAVPLLVTGRLGDRFGPKNIYLIGLVVFTAASLWCGLSGTITMLIVARVFQGLGASLMTPQTMAVITRMFPPDRRGTAMGLWGAVAGVATLVGPIARRCPRRQPRLGVDLLRQRARRRHRVRAGLAAGAPAETHSTQFDIPRCRAQRARHVPPRLRNPGGQPYDWGTIADRPVWRLIVAGLVLLAAFFVWQSLNKNEPLLPLGLFRTATSRSPTWRSPRWVRDHRDGPAADVLLRRRCAVCRPTQSALLLVPMAVLSGVSGPVHRQARRPDQPAVHRGRRIPAVSIASLSGCPW